MNQNEIQTQSMTDADREYENKRRDLQRKLEDSKFELWLDSGNVFFKNMNPVFSNLIVIPILRVFHYFKMNRKYKHI